MDIIHIKEPFYSAGKQYNWPGKTIGLGIAENKLRGEYIYVRVGDSPKIWKMETARAKALAKKYHSYFNAQGTPLVILPWELFEGGK